MAETKYFLDHLNHSEDLKSVCKSQGAPDVHNFGNMSTNLVQAKKPIQLPDIKLPTFFGAYEQWIEYRDTFKSCKYL